MGREYGFSLATGYITGELEEGEALGYWRKHPELTERGWGRLNKQRGQQGRFDQTVA